MRHHGLDARGPDCRLRASSTNVAQLPLLDLLQKGFLTYIFSKGPTVLKIWADTILIGSQVLVNCTVKFKCI